MQKKTRSLLEELELIGNNRDVSHLIENRARNIITSAINLLELINRHYDKNTAEVLERKLLNSIRVRDQDKFTKSLKKNEHH